MNKKNCQITSQFPTSLTDKDLVQIKRVMLDYLKTHEFVTNRILREIVSVTYDQAIFFFGKMLKQKVLKKIGISSGTRYVKY